MCGVGRVSGRPDWPAWHQAHLWVNSFTATGAFCQLALDFFYPFLFSAVRRHFTARQSLSVGSEHSKRVVHTRTTLFALTFGFGNGGISSVTLIGVSKSEVKLWRAIVGSGLRLRASYRIRNSGSTRSCFVRVMTISDVGVSKTIIDHFVIARLREIKM